MGYETIDAIMKYRIKPRAGAADDKAADTLILKAEQTHDCTAEYGDYGQDGDD